MKTQFELEQEILDCWGICEDLDVLFECIAERHPSQDQLMNIVLGMKEIYQLKFERTFETFETLTHNGQFDTISKRGGKTIL